MYLKDTGSLRRKVNLQDYSRSKVDVNWFGGVLGLKRWKWDVEVCIVPARREGDTSTLYPDLLVLLGYGIHAFWFEWMLPPTRLTGLSKTSAISKKMTKNMHFGVSLSFFYIASFFYMLLSSA